METLKELSYLKVVWDNESKTQITTWIGGYDGRDIRKGLDIALDIFKDKKKTVPDCEWIGDTRDIGVIGDEDKEWIDTDWFPRFLATGVKLMAVVIPKSAIASMSVKLIVSKIEGTNLTSKYTSTVEEAIKWIVSERR